MECWTVCPRRPPPDPARLETGPPLRLSGDSARIFHEEREIPTDAYFDVEQRNRFAPAEFAGINSALTANSSPRPESPKTTANAIEVEGKIVAVLPGTMFRVQLANGHVVLGHISGKLRKHFIKIAAGDTVKMEMSPYDLEKARITYRVKETSSTYRPPMRRRR